MSDWEKSTWMEVKRKSEMFLRQVMGDDTFNIFTKDGKVEIKSGNTVYELYSDGRIRNKKTNESYCVTPTRPDYPIYDIIAIKYCWLKYDVRAIEKVANKSRMYSARRYDNAQGIDGRRDGFGYDAFVHYMESQGWISEYKVINESSDYVTTYDVEGFIGDIPEDMLYVSTIIDIKCPATQMMTMMGINQAPDNVVNVRSPAGLITTIAGINRASIGYSFSLHITGNDGNEISDNTRIRMSAISPSCVVRELARCTYSDLRSIDNIDDNGIVTYRTRDQLYRWRQGILLKEGQYLRVDIVGLRTKIMAKDIKFEIYTDFWTK